MINEKKIERMCENEGFECKIFQATNKVLIDNKHENWMIEVHKNSVDLFHYNMKGNQASYHFQKKFYYIGQVINYIKRHGHKYEHCNNKVFRMKELFAMANLHE